MNTRQTKAKVSLLSWHPFSVTCWLIASLILAVAITPRETFSQLPRTVGHLTNFDYSEKLFAADQQKYGHRH